MSIYSYYGANDPDVQLTPEEKQLSRDAQAQGSYAAGGSAIGGTLGAIGGGIIGSIIPGGGTLAGAGLGMTAGTAIGNWLGSLIGGNIANEAQDRLAAIEEKKFGPEEERAARIQAMNQLIGQWTPYL